ncbi:MAG: hypothetical protein B7Z53_06260, partial [Rhodospirillales bacterium 12-71-4]
MARRLLFLCHRIPYPPDKGDKIRAWHMLDRLARMRTLLFGDALISTPFCVYGGPVSATPEAAQALESHARELMRRTGVPCLEFRRRDAADAGWDERPALHHTFRRAITGDAEADM